jgi:hypothetical protein
VAKVVNTRCPITTLIVQNKPKFRPFQHKNEDLPKKQTQYLPVPMSERLVSAKQSDAGSGDPDAVYRGRLSGNTIFDCCSKTPQPCEIRVKNYNLFMQNEPNFIHRRRIATAVMTRRYGNIMNLSERKNEPKLIPVRQSGQISSAYLSGGFLH